MKRRSFITNVAALAAATCIRLPGQTLSNGVRLARAARTQLGVTRAYDPNWATLPYPGGDVSRSTGVCADVVIRAARDGLHLDLQQLVHEDMVGNFDLYPAHSTWGSLAPNSSVDHRRILNLETYWRRVGAELWHATEPVAGDAFPLHLAVGDIVTWLLNGRVPHIGVIVSSAPTHAIHNNGKGAEESPLSYFHAHNASAHYRWPRA